MDPHARDHRYELTHLQALEAESIHIIREVAAEFERPVLLFSGGKDSIVMLPSPRRRSGPRRDPVPGHARRHRAQLRRGHRLPRPPGRRAGPAARRRVRAGRHRRRPGGRGHRPRASRNRLQTTTLLDAIEEHRFDAVFGGARRDEEKARAKERVFSFRDEFGQWDPKNQRPELWNLYNGRIRKGEHIRVFPLSNWTELDIWQYIADEGIELPSIYYAHRRRVFQRDGMLAGGRTAVTLPEDGEERRGAHGALPHRRRRHLHRRGRLDADHRRDVSPRSPPPGSPSGAPPGPTTASPRPPWKTASARGTSDGAAAVRHRRVGRRRQVHAHRPAALRLEADLRGPARGRRAHQPRAGDEYTNLALLTDGLRAEREQGITIDVAYRYFATPKRKFIIADTPGHIQYTRNMVTGASTADLALILVDARKGIVEQSRRHAFLASLLGIPHLVLCVNKMDLVDWTRSGSRRSRPSSRVRHEARRPRPHVRPISALHGDNVVDRSAEHALVRGPALLHHLERCTSPPTAT